MSYDLRPHHVFTNVLSLNTYTFRSMRGALLLFDNSCMIGETFRHRHHTSYLPFAIKASMTDSGWFGPARHMTDDRFRVSLFHPLDDMPRAVYLISNDLFYYNQN